MPLEVVSEQHVVIPSWWGDSELHATHRANLLRKDADYYSRFGWSEMPRNGYLWILNNKRVLVDNSKKQAKRAARQQQEEQQEEKPPVKRKK